MLSRQLPRRTIASAASLSTSSTLVRPFSTTLGALNANRSGNPNQRQQKQQQQPQIRRNPLIGEIQRAPNPPVSTEKPRATTTPHPSRAPASSAEVPPNADLPPPPSTITSAEASSSSLSPSGVTGSIPVAGGQQPRYDARSEVINLADLIGKSAERYVDSIEDPATQHKVHTRPITGRTVFLEHAGRNSAASRQGLAASGIQHAFRVLDRTIKDQKIKTLFYQQRFHERPGMKRKRLKMVRWRARFKKGFKATASRVLELRKQGW